MIKRACILAMCLLPLSMFQDGRALGQELKVLPEPENYNPARYLDDRVELKPLFDTPLRHTYITRGPDDVYYLTGTVSADDKGDDFQNNRGVRIWKSKDLKQWEDLGFVWDIARDAKVSLTEAWQRQRNLNPDDPSGPLVRGMTAPELHFLKGTWWIPYSMNNHGTGLLKSSSGKPEGPYEDVGRITADGGNASLFEDFDGQIYWLWGSGCIAPMKADLSGLNGPPALLCVDASYSAAHRTPALHALESFSLLKTDSAGKRYFLVGEYGDCRLGGYTRDTFIFASDSFLGPYASGKGVHSWAENMLLEHGGQSVPFQDVNGDWHVTFYGADDKAVWRDRPGIVSARFDKARGRPTRSYYFKDFTTRGPWATKQPLMPDVRVNDEQIINAPDGYYYFTGSMFGDSFRKHGISVWKSKSLEPRSVKPENWQEFTPVTYADIPFIVDLSKQFPDILDFTGNPYGPPGERRTPKLGTMWNAEIHYLKGTFWIMGNLSFIDRAVQTAFLKKQEEAGVKGFPLWRSKTGKAEGPYEIHAWIGYSCPSFFEDDDGSVYHLEGVNRIRKMKDDMTGYDEEWLGRMQAEHPHFRGSLMQKEGLNMDYDIGNYMVKIGGKYVFFSCNCIGGYDYQYWVAEDILGPYSRPRVCMPHGGHTCVMKGKDGKWYGLQWARTSTMQPFLHELHVEDTGDDVIIMPKWEYEYRTASGGKP